ncbi:MAG: hypothetical protein CTY37_04695 [Methylotenera sp.]|nr:MAG: hypothetical protein CTY37_04695 [Methylotenera sp.]
MQNLEAEDITEKKSEQALLEGARCLIEYIKIHGLNNQSFEIINYLANETIERISQKQDGWQFTNEAIYKAIVGNKAADYSSWFSRYWKKVDEISRIGLEDFARENGYKHFAWIEKKSGGGSGNQSLYFLAEKPVQANVKQSLTNLKSDINYIEITNVSPSWWAKWLFNQGNSATGWRKMIYVLYPIAELIVVFILGSFLWIIAMLNKNPLNAQHVALFLFIIILLLYVRNTLIKWSKIVEDRIVMASDNLLSWGEHDVCLDLVTSPDKKTKILRLVKYASKCPICETEIILDKGEPDFPRRIVGRCKESPREHVYSFDRVTLSGNKLRYPSEHL